jgi:predicted nucleic acid-binding protein
MSNAAKKYCLDANVLIQAWNFYYSPNFCPSYWDVLNELGSAGTIFIPEVVYDEITRTDDDLCKWVKQSSIALKKIDEEVANYLRAIYAANPIHITLVDNVKRRSLADPWVIAHAMRENATVVTKEEKVTALNASRIKIPNVCENMGVEWMNDFGMIGELGIIFKCAKS